VEKQKYEWLERRQHLIVCSKQEGSIADEKAIGLDDL
jgi:hypothetical protein